MRQNDKYPFLLFIQSQSALNEDQIFTKDSIVTGSDYSEAFGCFSDSFNSKIIRRYDNWKIVQVKSSERKYYVISGTLEDVDDLGRKRAFMVKGGKTICQEFKEKLKDLGLSVQDSILEFYDKKINHKIGLFT